MRELPGTVLLFDPQELPVNPGHGLGFTFVLWLMSRNKVVHTELCQTHLAEALCSHVHTWKVDIKHWKGLERALLLTL